MGWVMAREGEAEAGLELMRRSATERGATEARWYQPRYLCMLAESYLWHGRAEEGLIAVAEADAAHDANRPVHVGGGNQTGRG